MCGVRKSIAEGVVVKVIGSGVRVMQKVFGAWLGNEGEHGQGKGVGGEEFMQAWG